MVDRLSTKDYGPFFQQWFFTPGHPVLSAGWEYAGDGIRLWVRQHQEGAAFSFPLDLLVELEDGSSLRKTLQVSERLTSVCLEAGSPPVKVMLDPDTWLLFETYRPDP